jgi:hypothetical protein
VAFLPCYPLGDVGENATLPWGDTRGKITTLPQRVRHPKVTWHFLPRHPKGNVVILPHVSKKIFFFFLILHLLTWHFLLCHPKGNVVKMPHVSIIIIF